LKANIAKAFCTFGAVRYVMFLLLVPLQVVFYSIVLLSD